MGTNGIIGINGINRMNENSCFKSIFGIAKIDKNFLSFLAKQIPFKNRIPSKLIKSSIYTIMLSFSYIHPIFSLLKLFATSAPSRVHPPRHFI